MLSRPVPLWILAGGFVLSAIAGSVNAMGFLGVEHGALSHMSGTATILSTEIARGNPATAAHAALLLLAFFAGCILSTWIVRDSALQAGRRYGVALMAESALLAAATVLLSRGHGQGAYLATMACGLQNALATTYSGAVIRTTHVTGILTDLGIAAGNALRGEPVERRRVLVLATLFAGFLLGGVVGGGAFVRWGVVAMAAPAAITFVAGAGYAIYRHLHRDFRAG